MMSSRASEVSAEASIRCTGYSRGRGVQTICIAELRGALCHGGKRADYAVDLRVQGIRREECALGGQRLEACLRLRHGGHGLAPGQDLKATVLVLADRGAAFDPVTAVDVGESTLLP